LVLGSDYNFETALFEDCENNIYLKLGGDVLLTQKDLNNLISNLKNKKINNIYIDDSIFENEKYPSSWLDEDKWPTSSEISPYIIDKNWIEISINRSSLAKKVDIVQDDEYKLPIINELVLGDIQDIKIERLYGENSSIINLKGTVVEDETIALPVLKPEVNFNIKLNEALKKNNIVHINRIEVRNTPLDAKKIASIKRPILDISKPILHQSDNFAAEVVFRVAGSYFYNKTATLDDSVKMFYALYGKSLAPNEKIADASGVSRQNIISAKTIANIFLDISSKANILSLMPSSNDGTMGERLLFLKDNLRAKTGTMRDMSALMVNMCTRKNTDIFFVSIVQNSSKRKALLKHYENTLLGIIYKNY
jgi:PBP4 family serine-type D-alanyl-D-alanine carboxypeptidase